MNPFDLSVLTRELCLRIFLRWVQTLILTDPIFIFQMALVRLRLLSVAENYAALLSSCIVPKNIGSVFVLRMLSSLFANIAKLLVFVSGLGYTTHQFWYISIFFNLSPQVTYTYVYAQIFLVNSIAFTIFCNLHTVFQQFLKICPFPRIFIFFIFLLEFCYLFVIITIFLFCHSWSPS